MTAPTERLSRRATVERLLEGVPFGEPGQVEALYALAGRNLFGDVRAALDSKGITLGSQQVWLRELLWYHEACVRFRQKMKRYQAITWMLHREDDRCGYCGSAEPSRDRGIEMFDGVALRICGRCLGVHQKLRDQKDCA